MKDYEALATLKKNGMYIGGIGHEEVKDATKVLPTERERCHKCLEVSLFPVTLIREYCSRKTKVLYRCHKCGKWETRTYIPPRKEYKLLTTEELKRIELRKNGMSEDEIIEYCNIYRDDFRKEDKEKENARREAHSKRFNHTSEDTYRMMLKLRGVDKEDIDEICSLKKDEFAKQDAANRIREKNDEANRRAKYEEEERLKEQSSFKARLDSGEVVYVAKARAFVEVATGKVVRKL